MSTQPPSSQSWQPTLNPTPPPMAYPPPRKSGVPVWAWIVGCGGIGCMVVPFLIFAAVLFPVFAKAREKARQTSCMSNEKLIGTALMMYTQDNDGVLPEGTHWMDRSAPYLASAGGTESHVFQCPSAKGTPYGYAYNSAVSRKSVNKMGDPGTTVTVYDSTAGTKNATDAVMSVPSPGRHSGGNNFAFADGHVRYKKTSGGKTDHAE